MCVYTYVYMLTFKVETPRFTTFTEEKESP